LERNGNSQWKLKSGNISQRCVLQDLSGMLKGMYKHEGKPRKVFINLFCNRFMNWVISLFFFFLILIWMWKAGVKFQGFVPRPIWVPGSFLFIVANSGLQRSYTELWQKNSRPLDYELGMTFLLRTTSIRRATPRINILL